MRTHALTLIALAGVAVPATAIASQGADDPPGHDRTTTVQTTATTVTQPTTPRSGLTAGERAAAIRAAKARVGSSAVVVSVRRKSGSGATYEVRLRNSTHRFTVRLNRGFKPIRVQRELLRKPATAAAPAGDDGTADQGRGDAPRTAPSSAGVNDDGTPDQGHGDAPGTAPTGGNASDDGTPDQGHGDTPVSGSHGGQDDGSSHHESGHGGSGGHGADD